MKQSEEKIEIEELLNELLGDESLEAQRDTSIGILEPIDDESSDEAAALYS